MKQLVVIVLLVVNLVVAGCTQTTTGIWKKPAYHEKISQFLITEDGKKLVFIGKKHHYIFDNEDTLKGILQWEHRGLLQAKFWDRFAVDESNGIAGSYEIQCDCKDATSEQKTWLQKMGFKQIIEQGSLTGLIFEDELEGKRYAAGEVSLDGYSKLNREYDVLVEAEMTTSGRLVRAAFTPVAIAEDGIATIGLVALMVIAAPFALFSIGKEGGTAEK